MNQSFRYQARKKNGEVVAGIVTAESEEVVYRDLVLKGLFPVSISVENSEQPAKRKALTLPTFFSTRLFTSGVGSRDLSNLFDQMALLLTSGFPLLKAVEMVHGQTSNETLKSALSKIATDLQTGARFSELLRLFPNVFSRSVIGAVEAGEASGKLEVIFRDLSKAFDAEAELKAKISQALVYPAFVVLFGAATVIFIMTFVIPRLMVFFETWDHPLPLPTRFLMVLSRLFTHGLGFVLLAAIVLGVIYWKRLSKHEKAKTVRKILKPFGFFDFIFFLIDFVPLVRTLSLLVRSGVPLISAMKTASDIVINIDLKRALDKVSEDVSHGRSLKDALRDSKAFPELALNFMSVGEESGNMDVIFEKIAIYYERILDQKMRLVTTLLEPMLILVIGIGIAFIVLSMLLPIFDINLMAQ